MIGAGVADGRRLKILLIRLRLIGDVIFTTPLVAALRRRFPYANLGYVVEPHAAPVVADNPHLDEVIVASPPGRSGRAGFDFSLARQLRARAYDVVIDLHGGPRSAMLSWISGAPRRIGYDVTGRSWMYTERVHRSRDLQPRHSVVNQWDLIRPLGFADPSQETDPTEMPVSAVAAGAVRERLRAAGIDPEDGPILVVHVSAGNPFRRWPAASFVELLRRLAEADSRRRLLVISGPSERDAARAIGAQARSVVRGGGTILDGFEVNLPELRALLEWSALFVGGDSGPLHIAGTTGVPIVGLYGPTLSARSAPWRPRRFVTESLEIEGLPCRPCHQRECEPGDFRCLGGITPARVAEAAERALATARTTRSDVHHAE